MNYQWYPGHMTKAKRMMEENIKLIDLVIEIVDARIPISSRNPDIDSLAVNKARIILLNKSDLADDKKGTAFQFNGLNEQVKPSEDVCKKVSIDFGAQSATLVYDEASNTYKKEIDGNAQIDGKTGNQLAFTNVFVLETTISVKDDLGHKAVDWDGWEDSMGYYISNGAKQKIHWSKEENNELSRLTFYDESGNEISINRGKSYIAFNYPNQTTYE